ncbi:MAG: hypothetical protein PSV17_12025 [Methylotenera sp.]|uniref:hypothetical protein n=1 Tax=Methylotenera sp. TaxID=2051956 RepID=UPI002489721D|nr:hypothetical protein [Methylotenera sp.]MDI1310138.1 hypothetical protein [Methylotenera sp.]
MHKNISIIVFILTSIFSFSTYAGAGSCGELFSFTQAYDDVYTKYVIHGKVMGYLYFSSPQSPPELRTDLLYGQEYSPIQIEVKNVLKGEFNRPIIAIRTGGFYLWKRASDFPVGTEWILSINNDGGISWCGDYALKVEGDEVITNYKRAEEKRINIYEFYKSLGLLHLTPHSRTSNGAP